MKLPNQKMGNPAFIVVLITSGSLKEAQRISEALLGQKQVACVNIVPRILSRFWWQDKIVSESEVLLLAKTRMENFARIVNLVKEIHSYDVPEIIALPVLAGSDDYLEWIGKETKK